MSHATGCAGKIMSKGSLMYAIDLNHNHASDPIVFIDTTELVTTKATSALSNPEPETIAATIKQPTVKNDTPDLKEKLKQRFAILNRKLQK